MVAGPLSRILTCVVMLARIGAYAGEWFLRGLLPRQLQHGDPQTRRVWEDGWQPVPCRLAASARTEAVETC